MFTKIISGGQTGVDRAALDAAQEANIPRGGWCPQGRRAEDGPLRPHYPLLETPSEAYAERTEWNVRDSDGTLVLTRGTPTQGTAFTIEVAARLKKACLVLDVDDHPAVESVHDWARTHRIDVLNVAGPREAKCPGIYGETLAFLRRVFGAPADHAPGSR